GPGNNGGDGLVAARHLHDWGAKVRLFLIKRQMENDKNFALDMERNIPWTDAFADDDPATFGQALASADMVIDSLFGTGKIRPFEGVIKRMLEQVMQEKALRPALVLLAIDLPSGLDADTGAIDPASLLADLTVTLGYPKIGLLRFPGAGNLGQLEVADIGIPSYLAEGIKNELITAESVRGLLPSRPLDANKGTFGKLLVVAGSINYIGAAHLACESAMRVGTGLVTLATPRSLQAILATRLIEVTYIPLPETEAGVIGAEAVPVVRERLADYDAVLLGCGLGHNPATVEFVKRILPDLNMPLIIDADGLNILAQIPDWWRNLKGEVILTPHPGEMSRLLGSSVAEVQENRLETAIRAARQWNQTVVLKGAYTVVASPDGRAGISPVANPGLASAGTGDVLAGAIAGMRTQGLASFEAAICGVHLHSISGEIVRAEIGDAGMIAGDLLQGLPLVLKGIKQGT
ncbi:MAG: NAD(P)H-hydrate dehydratase, partial [Chloroflexota bacterium]|nr:NAD(P)H-hydrate dehydratase [Chloroflexota bacterium]